ncbi:MARTX multifunctional-autoprocessing repeats-in-toxin holotoxin RtxA [Aeromonas popoffii]|uniref:MARTX multifunctional-autoprocessing repeats-in-toxin holotoxin RtxA n=1 Tax=Aeromonas popoffii TaxID=70856 RepID=A0ABS5GTN4_9GAMM|nr:MARTX multifunctional-autoprocessing repeats-in-toxin holotoxin RtxA [Aeromonas popoffii]MBR7630388.1 MARTX multifunctional-autoprocessing repeats-in-toxin holotoxin RtxA [Aeromonas popoffii]
MGQSVWRSIEYFFTGNYTADDGNNDIDAVGFGGVIRAYGGDDTIKIGSIGATVYTGTGNDSVYGGAAYLKVVDESGNLTVKGAAGYADISKSESGNIHFAGASGGTNIDHQGREGDIRYQGAAFANVLTRKGISGNVSFEGAGGYNKLWHQTDRGDVTFSGAGAANQIDRTWHSQYQGSRGNISFHGAGAANIISSQVESGNLSLNGAGAYNKVFRKGREGDVTFNGAGGWNEISRLRHEHDAYLQTRGDIRFIGGGGYNRLLSDVAEGNIHFKGAGGYNHLSRQGAGSDSSPFAGARADEIVLTTATMGGSWINQSHAVTAIKSSLQPNTYLFAFFDGMYTKVNRITLSNEGEHGALRYLSTSWYKEGNQLEGLASQQIDDHHGFISTQTDGAYRLSDLVFERRQRIKLDAVEADLTENSWINYGGGVNVAAADVTLSSAKMSGYAIFEDGTKVDVSAITSRVQANTYVFAKQLGPYTKIVVVELANDQETGALKYLSKAWYKEGNHLAGLANQVISERTGFTSMGKGGYSLSEVHYQLDTVTAVSDRLPATREFSSQLLLPRQQDGGNSKGDIFFDGAGAGNVIESDVTEGNIHFNGAGAANVLIKRGQRGDLVFRGAGLANVLVHQGAQGKMDVNAAGAANVLVRSGDGEYLARLLAYGNISVQQGRGDSQVVMLGGYNTHTQIGDGNGLWLAGGGANVLTQVGEGQLDAMLVGGANVLTKLGAGQLTAGLLGGANVLTHISQGDEAADTRAVLLGGANVLTKQGNGKVQAILGGGVNVLTQIGRGDTQALLLGAANVLTRVGDGDLSAVMLGAGNVLTHVGDGATLGVMGAAGNLFTKVGDGTAIAAMIGAGNLFTQIGKGDAWALMGGVANVFTKVGDGNALALMVAKANVFTHVGDGLTVALMLAQGNLATKVGNGMTLAAMVGNANVFTHVGRGETFAAMLGQANLMTKVGDGLTAALMIGKANVYSHIGNGTSLGLFAGELNVMTKVGDGTTLAALFGKANIVTHVGSGLTGVLALGKANIITKVGDDFLGVLAKADANVLTHVGNGTTAAVLWGKGNLLTKIGDGTTVGLLISEVGNVMTHVGAGSTIGLAKGRANLITKVGDGLVVQGAWGEANLLTQVGDGDRYSFAKGRANVLTKVGDGRELAVLQGEANLVTQVGDGDSYTGAWGRANIITKVGDGRQVVLAKGDANIVTQVGDGESYQALLGKANVVTRVGDGIQVTLAKGELNQTTTVGDGLSVTAAYGKFNNNIKVGDGSSINLAWGDYNFNTKVGDGLNVAVMKGKGNANIQIGDGLDVTAAYARHNVAIKIGNGDFYSLALASSNTSSNKLGTLFDNIKQTLLGAAGNQAINYLVQGDEEGPVKAPPAASLGDVQALSGFGLDEIGEVKSSLASGLTGQVSQTGERDEQAMDKGLQLDEQGLARGGENLIVNGDFEQGAHGWQHAGEGIEAEHSATAYGLATEGHGARVSELSTDRNTQISQDLVGLKAGETVTLNFDFARRANISLQHGIEVLWNGERVFASMGDADSWQSKQLTMTARAGSNTLAFSGTGENNGFGYLLDNVVATAAGKAELGQVSAQLVEDGNAARAQADRASADADKQRLEQEKAQQLAAISGAQAQLDATDEGKLATNGQAPRTAIEAEARDITAQLDSLARQFEPLKQPEAATIPSGQHWRHGFADRLLTDLQGDLEKASGTAGEAIADARSRREQQSQQVDAALAQSKSGQQRSEQLQGEARAQGQSRTEQAEQRRLDALTRDADARQRQQEGESSASKAQAAGEQASSQASQQATQARQNAASLKQSGDKPSHQGVNNGQSPIAAPRLPQAGELDVPNATGLSTDAAASAQPSAIDAANGVSEQDQSALDGALAAVNRLQINAGLRAHGTPAITLPGMVGEREADTTTVPASHASSRRSAELGLSGVSLAGLGSPVRGPAVAVPETAGFAFELLKREDNDFIDATRRQLGKLSTDLPSERLKAVREAVVRVQQQPSEANLGLLEQSLSQWQARDPKEFAQRGELVTALRFEVASLQSHTFAFRAKAAGVYGLALPPEQTARFEHQLLFDGIGRITGAVGELSAADIARVTELSIRPLTDTNSNAERQAPRTEHDSLIAFAHQLGQFDTPQTRLLADEVKAIWFSGEVNGPRTIALFETASKTLGDQPQLQVLAQALLADANKSKTTSQYIDNLFGRRFDSEIAHALVTSPSQAAIDTSAQLGARLVKEFGDWIQTLQLDEATQSRRIDKKMAAFAEAIKKDTRPWFSRVPSLTDFLAEPNLATFKQMMTRVDNGFDVIKVPFLAVKMATHPELGMDMADWKREGDHFYGNVITKARSTSTEIASAKDGLLQVDLPDRTTSDYGTGLHYQPGGDKYDDFLNGRSVADGRILTPGKETTFERNALDKGLPVVTGASGSTNIMVHLNNYLAAKEPGYSPSQAYLNTLAFLVFDGGHSVNESLAVYQALQASGDARKQVLESYTANYRDLVMLAGDAGKAAVQDALDRAFGRTLDFYQQHAYSAQLAELAALGSPRKVTAPVDVVEPASSGKPVSMESDGSAPVDRQSLNPLTRFLNDNLYGTRDERRQVDEMTRQLLDHAVSKGEAAQVTLQGEAGRLSGYLHKGAPRDGQEQKNQPGTSPEVVLFLHGSGSSAEEQADAVRSHYQKQGIDMLAVNLRGYGASDGGPSEQGVYQDARTMFRYLVEERGVAPDKILIHGYSMGGPIAADLARYAAEQGKPVGGLLLDRPMPSMSKAIRAHELPNPGGLVGAIAKAVNGRFSVEKNLDGLPKSTPIMLLTDNEGLGSEGEKLRAKLAVAGYQVSGEQTFYGHLASNRLMGQYAGQIVGDLFNRKSGIDFSTISRPDELKKAAQVFAKPIGESYQGILDQLTVLHSATGQAQVEAALRLNNLLDGYLARHESSGRNPALSQLQSQLNGSLYRGELASLQADVAALAKRRPDLAALVIGKAVEEANGKHPGLTQMSLRWVAEDPYLAVKGGYQGQAPADLPFDASFHVVLGEQYGELKKWLADAQSKGLLSKAVLDETGKVLHLGYSYQELQDMTGDQSAQMTVYFIKEAAKQAAPGSELSAEMIMLDQFADRRYLGELESRRLEQVENIYHSSKQTDVAAWDARYAGNALRDLNDQVAQESTLAGQLSRLLENRNGLLIGETHGSDVNGLRFVNEQMDALKAQGVTVIGLEHLRGELAQPLIDRYLAGGEMSPELATMLKTKHLDLSLFERAREKGLRIVALDDGSTARPAIAGTEHGLMYRAGAANNVAVDVLGKLPAGEKFVAIYGSAHLASHKGIEGFVPGITHRLGLPALKVDADNRLHLQEDDTRQRVEYGDVARKWTPVAGLDGADQPVRNQQVTQWQQPEVTPVRQGGETRFDGQIIIQTEDDPVAAKAAASLAGKHPDHSVVMQLDADGNYRLVYGDPAQLAGNIRWQVVGHGRDGDEQNNSRLSGYSADELAGRLRRFGDRLQEAGVASKPGYVSLVGCSLVSDDQQTGFASRFIKALKNEGISAQVSARSSEVAVDLAGRKHTRGEDDVWARKVAGNKVVLTLNEAGEPVAHTELVRGGVAEGDIDLAKVGRGDGERRARGAIADNDETFVAPEKQHQPEPAAERTDHAVSYSGNIQVNVGDGEFTAINWGTSNLGVKVGTGGMKSLAFGDNNVMVHIGDGDSKHSLDIAGYRALEGAQLFVGQRNVSFNLGRSNDLIVMLEKSIPTPPMVNPFGGAARIAGALQQIAGDGSQPDWVASQWEQWTLAGADKFVADMAGLDQTSSVKYGSLTALDSDHERSSRGFKSDLEATLNKAFNKRISGGGQGEQGPLSRADKLRQANEKLVFNFAVAGQGADIQVTTGNWNFVFGDNIQAILDTNLGSLFGILTQEFTSTGQAKTTFTFTPTDLPRQLQNRLLGRLAGVGADTTLADIFGVDYNARGQLVARDGAAIDAPALLQEMLGVIAEFGGDQLKSLTDPAKWLDSLKAGLDMGTDALGDFARTHGLQAAAPEEAKPGEVTVQQGEGQAKAATQPAATQEKAFGFNALNLPNLFATLFNGDKQAEIKALASNLKQNLTADLLNMEEQTFDFLRSSGHLQGDGDMHVSLGNYNFNWGGDGKDLGAYLGDNNNFWGGRGDDVFYATGTSNIFTGGAGQDTGIMMGRENMMFGGQGDDVAVLAGRVNRAFMGEGNDQVFIFGEEGIVEGGAGQDYLVTSGNYNQIDAGADQDFAVTIGHHNQIRLGEGDDVAIVFGNHNRLLAEHGNNQVKLMGYHATIRGGDGRDRLIADRVAKFSQLDGGDGDDLLVLGGYQNRFSGGTGVDSFVFSGEVIENLVQDIGKEDFIVFNDVSWRDLWFKRSGYDLQLLVNRHTDGASEQDKFEQLGCATFSNYFADNRAQLVIGLGEQQAEGERAYTALSHHAVDSLIQAMSSFAPEAGDMGLINRLDSQANSLVQSAWGDVIQGRARIA